MKLQVIQVYVGIMMISALATLCMASEKMLSATDLVDKYTQALDSTLSFIEEYEQTTNASYWVSNSAKDRGVIYRRGQVRHENQRIYQQEYIWGDHSKSLKNLPEDKPYYHCNIVDGNKKITYQNSGWINKSDAQLRASRGSYTRKEEVNLGRYFGISYILGYVGSDQRLDTILRNANRISVLGRMANIGDSECYVMNAETKYGRYRIWLDPKHGYHAVKINRDAEGGHYTHSRKISEGGAAKTYLENIRFEKVDDTWVPMEWDAGCDRHTPEGYFVKEDYHYKRTKIILNPDHEALGSFADPIFEDPANDPELKDGTRIRINNDPKEYIWQDGKVVDSEGKVILEPSGHKAPPEKKKE